METAGSIVDKQGKPVPSPEEYELPITKILCLYYDVVLGRQGGRNGQAHAQGLVACMMPRKPSYECGWCGEDEYGKADQRSRKSFRLTSLPSSSTSRRPTAGMLLVDLVL